MAVEAMLGEVSEVEAVFDTVGFPISCCGGRVSASEGTARLDDFGCAVLDIFDALYAKTAAFFSFCFMVRQLIRASSS